MEIQLFERQAAYHQINNKMNSDLTELKIMFPGVVRSIQHGTSNTKELKRFMLVFKDKKDMPDWYLDALFYFIT